MRQINQNLPDTWFWRLDGFDLGADLTRLVVDNGLVMAGDLDICGSHVCDVTLKCESFLKGVLY